MISLTKQFVFVTMMLSGTASAAINMAGTWQFTLPFPNLSPPTTVVYSGPLVQVGNSLSDFAPFSAVGSSCATSVTLNGTISDVGSVTISVNVNGTRRVLTGTVSADGNSASGTFVSDPGGCLDTNPGTWTGTRAQQVLPQFAFGGGWYSAMYFANMGTNPASFTVTFAHDDGTPLNVASVGGSSTIVNLAPGGTAIIEAPNVGDLSEGSAFLALPGGVVGYGVFRQSLPGEPDQEAVVPLSNTSTTASELIWDETNFTTAVAMVNPSSVTVTVNITVRDRQGNTIGTSSVTLAPRAKTALALRLQPGLGAMLGSRGSASFTVSAGGVAVLGLRFYGTAFTSIPTADR